MVVERNNLERTFSQLRSRCNLQRKALASVEDEIVRVRRELVACPRGSALRLPASHQSEMKSESSCLMHSVERELSAERALSQQFASCESRANEIRDNFQGLRIDTEREQQLCQLLSRHAQYLHRQLLALASSTSAKQDSRLLVGAAPLCDSGLEARQWSRGPRHAVVSGAGQKRCRCSPT
mmetsp:Transcript_62478/g.167300  ORF Transcript_62478/g.167300 Transcript_62478/m.167300 type:complete len:181 (+) Transcript_62478:182-724(+)